MECQPKQHNATNAKTTTQINGMVEGLKVAEVQKEMMGTDNEYHHHQMNQGN